MLYISRLFLAILPLVQSVYGAPTAAQFSARDVSTSPTLYFLENHVGGTSIVAVGMPKDGTNNANWTKTPAGGLGLRGNNAGVRAGPDSLYGQGAVYVSSVDNLLLSVNPGSRTLSLFAIDAKNPMSPKLIGTPAPTLGDFPMSVSYSSKLKTACVLNGGADSGVTCFSVNTKHGLALLDRVTRPLPKGFHQTTPPTGGANTTSQISFSPDDTFLVVTIKGDANLEPALPGWISTWPVTDGKVSRTAVVSTISTLLRPFGFGFLGSANTLLVSDPTHGGSIVSINRKFEAHSVAEIITPNITGSCWATTTPDLKTGFLINAGSAQSAMVGASTNTLYKVVDLPNGAPGGFDSVTDGKKLYVMAANAHIAVVDWEDTSKTQLLNLKGLEQRPSWQGLALYMPSS